MSLVFPQVNGTDMTGLTQGDAVSMLKATKTGAKVNLVVSRQVAVEEKYAKTKHLVSKWIFTSSFVSSISP